MALFHIGRVKKAVVSFGQGCEGEPLSAADAIEPAIRLIRAETGRGTINLNTNASLPERVGRLCDAGLDSMRVSVNSVRPECYEAYFRPKGYGFRGRAAQHRHRPRKGQVRLHQLPELARVSRTRAAEAEAFMAFLEDHPIHMIQWRNLNFDPIRYWKAMEAAAPLGEPHRHGGPDPGYPRQLPEPQVRLLQPAEGEVSKLR